MNNSPVVNVLVGIAAVAVIIVAALFVTDHITCFNLFGITKGCVTH